MAAAPPRVPTRDVPTTSSSQPWRIPGYNMFPTPQVLNPGGFLAITCSQHLKFSTLEDS